MKTDESDKPSEVETRPTRGEWNFSSLSDREFEEVAISAVRIFADKSVAKEAPSMADHLKETYIEGTPNLQEYGRRFEMPEADNNEIVVDFNKKRIYMYPHLGRGSRRHDTYVADAVETFDYSLNEKGIVCTKDLSIDDPNQRNW